VRQLPIRSVEIWNLINLTGDVHSIHVHLISYRIVERIHFRENGVADYIADRDAGTLAPLESYLDINFSEAPHPVERGPKDLALAPFGYVTWAFRDPLPYPLTRG